MVSNRRSVTHITLTMVALLLILFSAQGCGNGDDGSIDSTKASERRGEIHSADNTGSQTDYSGPGPRAVIEESMHDFGTVPEGKVLTHIFKVANAGKEPLRIIKAKGT